MVIILFFLFLSKFVYIFLIMTPKQKSALVWDVGKNTRKEHKLFSSSHELTLWHQSHPEKLGWQPPFAEQLLAAHPLVLEERKRTPTQSLDWTEHSHSCLKFTLRAPQCQSGTGRVGACWSDSGKTEVSLPLTHHKKQQKSLKCWGKGWDCSSISNYIASKIILHRISKNTISNRTVKNKNKIKEFTRW